MSQDAKRFDPQYLPYPGYLVGETEARKMIRRHMQDPTHVFTDEEIRNLEVGKINLAAVSLPAEKNNP